MEIRDVYRLAGYRCLEMDGSFARLSVVFFVSRQFCARVFLLLPKLS